MKKLYFALAMLLAVFGASAQTTTVTMTLNIDHADRVTVKYLDASYNDVIVEGLVDGDNQLKVPVGSYSKTVSIKAKEGYGLASCTALNPGATEPESCYIMYLTESSFEACADPTTEGAVWTVKTFNFEEARTASVTVDVDDASKVEMKRIGSNSKVTLTDGENTVRFIPAEGDKANESMFSISSTDWEKPLYQVLLNGEKIEGYSPETNTVVFKNGERLSILANYPDIKVPVKFNFTDGAEGFVTKITADGQDVEMKNNQAEVQCGSKVEFYYDELNYTLTSIAINGTKVEYPWSPISLGIVTEEVNVDIDAAKIGEYTIDVKVNDPSYVKLLAFKDDTSIYYGGLEIPLQAGENKGVKIPTNRHFFSIEAGSRSKLVAVSVNGEAVKQVEKTDYSGEVYYEWPFPLELNEGDVLEITGSGPVRDNLAVVYIDRIPEGSYSFDFNLNGYKPELAAGYNFVKFDSNPDETVGDLPFNISLYYEQMASWLYVNGEAVEPGSHSEYSDIYRLAEVENNSVIKLFTAAEPKVSSIAIETERLTDADYTVKTDYVTEIAAPSKGFNVVGPTAISITLSEKVTAKVEADGKTIEPDEEGVYTVTAEAPMTIKLISTVDGVESITAAEQSYDVYNLQGICLLRKVGREALTTLPQGLYIINGQKVKL